MVQYFKKKFKFHLSSHYKLLKLLICIFFISSVLINTIFFKFMINLNIMLKNLDAKNRENFVVF